MRFINLTRPEGQEPEDLHLSRRGLINGGAVAGLFFTGYALGPEVSLAQAIVTPSDGLLAKDLTIPTTEPYYQIPAYIAMPLKANKSPVILVVPEIFGLHDYIRDVCRRLANTGYVALSFDPFARAGNAASLNDMDKLRPLVETATNDMVMGDLKTLIKWLKSKPDIGQDKNILRRKVVFADTTKIGITGFCWGGAVAWMAAANIAEIKAGVAWYGRLERPDKTEFLGKDVRPWPIDIASNLSKPVLGLYADQDRGISLESVARMNQALKASGKTRSFIKVFKGAKHAFHADYRPSYKADAAKEGWMDMLNWFEINL